MDARLTRAGLLRTALGAGAIGAAAGARGGGGTSLAAQAGGSDAEILNFFLVLEHVQNAFYREAVRTGRLKGDLLTFARTVGEQEGTHVAFLTERLGKRARGEPETDFTDALGTPESFRDAAIELEEAAIAGYIGQGANLSHRTVSRVAAMVSVEARQVAWVRDLAGISPAPRAADPARKAGDVLAALRKKGYLA
jgi:Ferritin-like domain